MTASRFDILIAGDAGQGVLTTAVTIARSVSERGFFVAQTARYGAAARAGQVLAGVVISDGEIDFPYVEDADLLIAMSPDGTARAINCLKETGTLLGSGLASIPALPPGVTAAPESSPRPLSPEALMEAIWRIREGA